MTLRRGLVVFVVPDFEPTLGGTSRQAANQARALLAAGYDAVVLTQRTDPSWPRHEIRDGLCVERIGPGGRGAVSMKLLDLRAAWWLRRRRSTIAIVHVVMYPDFAAAAVLAGCGPRTIMVWAGLGDARDTLARPGAAGERTNASHVATRLVRAARRRLLRDVTHVALTTAIEHEVADVLATRAAIIIPTPVDTVRFHPPSDAERVAARQGLGLGNELAVVYAGHLRASKRVDRLIDAFTRLHAQGVAARLFVLGDSRAELDDCSGALRAQAARSAACERIVFTGGVHDVTPYLRAADVFVLPSDREGLSNAMLEALASGVPCIASASAGGVEVLDDTCGIVPDEATPEALATAMGLLADPQRRAHLGVGARRRAMAFSLVSVTTEYERLYARMRLAGFD